MPSPEFFQKWVPRPQKQKSTRKYLDGPVIAFAKNEGST